jgi:hypothetical protein
MGVSSPADFLIFLHFSLLGSSWGPFFIWRAYPHRSVYPRHLPVFGIDRVFGASGGHLSSSTAFPISPSKPAIRRLM